MNDELQFIRQALIAYENFQRSLKALCAALQRGDFVAAEGERQAMSAHLESYLDGMIARAHIVHRNDANSSKI